jgi:glycosyltransferase involved in cell wall biosynthesis
MKDNGAPLVSVVINFLDGERFLEEAIQSVFAQTYPNWELLLVDDGSKAQATLIAKRYAESHSDRVHYLEHVGHANRGMSASRNLGAAHARGEMLAFLDADDVYLPHKLGSQVEIMRAHPQTPLVCGAMQIWHSWNPQSVEVDSVKPFPIEIDRLIEAPELLRLWVRRQGGVFGTCGLLARTDVARQVGLFEESFRDMYEDMVFYTRIILSGAVYVSSDVCSRYRQHPDSSCAVVRRQGRMDRARLRYLAWLSEYLSQNAFQDRQVLEDLHVALWPHRHPHLELLFRARRSIQYRAGRVLARLGLANG